MEKRSFNSIKNNIKNRGLLWIPFLFLLVLVIFFEILPALNIFINSFRSETGFTLNNYIAALTKKYYLLSLKNSILVSLFSALVGLAIGTITALCLRSLKKDNAQKNITIINMTTNFSGVPLAFAYIILLGTNGLFTAILSKKLGINIYDLGFNLFSWTGITLIYVYFQVPLSIMLMYPAVDAIKNDTKEAALTLGASNFVFWRKIGLPVLLPSLLGSFGILFANALGAYATAYALVNANNNLLSITIAGLVSGDVTTNPYLASSLAVLMGLILILSMAINSRFTKKNR